MAKARLWAGLAVTSPIVRSNDLTTAESFMVSFALINDGSKAIDPEIQASRLLVNGKALKDWDVIIGNGPRDKLFNLLPAGQLLKFTYAMDRQFTDPGVYNIQWEGKSFKSSVVEFRVLAAHVAPLPPTDGVALVKELGPKDSIALLRIDSQKRAKVAIYRCTIEKSVYGPALPPEITMSFLHFPDCRQMDVGSRYLCVVRQSSGDDYELVRSDMLAGAAKDGMYNHFWPGGTEEAKKVVAGANRSE